MIANFIDIDSSVKESYKKSRAKNLISIDLPLYKRPIFQLSILGVILLILSSIISIFLNNFLIVNLSTILVLCLVCILYINPKLKKLITKKYNIKKTDFFLHWMNNDVRNIELSEFYSQLVSSSILNRNIGDIEIIKKLQDRYALEDSLNQKQFYLKLGSQAVLSLLAVIIGYIKRNDHNQLEILIIIFIILLLYFPIISFLGFVGSLGESQTEISQKMRRQILKNLEDLETNLNIQLTNNNSPIHPDQTS